MSSKQPWATIATVLVLSAVGLSGVWADLQANCSAGWEWNRNSLRQDPCLITSILEAACRGQGSYNIPPLDGTNRYGPPKTNSSDLACECNTVTYSLYMSCTACQGAQIYSWVEWNSACDSVVVARYPHGIPNGTAIPLWAFINVTELPGQNYSNSVAITIARSPEAKHEPDSTSSASHPSSTGSVGALVGAVLGSSFMLVIAALYGIGFAIILTIVAVSRCTRWIVRRIREGAPPPPPPVVTQSSIRIRAHASSSHGRG